MDTSGYVIVRRDHGRVEFVTVAGEASSFTRDIRSARIWLSKDRAEIEACDNESVEPLSTHLRGLQQN